MIDCIELIKKLIVTKIMKTSNIEHHLTNAYGITFSKEDNLEPSSQRLEIQIKNCKSVNFEAQTD